MDIYWILVFLIFLVGIPIQPHLSKRKAKCYLWIIFIMLFVVSAFRAYSVGADTIEYVRIFKNIKWIDITKSRYETGFLKYVLLLHSISSNPTILIAVSSAFCIGVTCFFVYKYSKNPILSMMLYILLGEYFSQMNIMRQAIALGIMEISFMIILENNSKKSSVLSFALMIVATLFHSAAIIGIIPWLLIVIIYRMNININFVKMMKYTAIAVIALSMLYSVVIQIVSVLIPKYADYFDSTWSDSNYNASLYNTLIQLSFGVIGLIILKNKRLNKIQLFSAVLLSMSIVFNIMSMRMEIWNRIAILFNVYTYLIWSPEILSEIKIARNRVVVYSVIILCSCLYMWIVLTYRPEWSSVVPYIFKGMSDTL